MRVASLVLLVITILVGCSHRDKPEDKSLKVHFTQYSTAVKDTFYIDVQLPNQYFEKPEKKFPTIILLDGNFYYPMMAPIVRQYEFIGLLHPAIIVSIGYKSFPVMDSLRERDYLYPKALPSDEIKTDGGAEKFYHYITKELLTKIDREYRTDSTRRSLLGHSFGGYFVLFSLMNQVQHNSHDFQHFVSASPSLWYNNFYLKKLPDVLVSNKDTLGIFISVGGDEDSVWSVKPVKDLAKEIETRSNKRLRLKTRIYNHLNHMDVPILSFTRGLQELNATSSKGH